MSNDQAQTAKTATTAVAERPRAVVVDNGLFNNMMDTSRFEHLQRVAKVFANSSLVPEHFRGKEADCFIAVEMAMRLQLHPFNLMQSLYVVHGKPGIEAKMAIALINSSGIFEGPVQFKLAGEGANRQCTAFAVHAKTRQLCETTVTMAMAKAEGWIDKSGSKWKTLPDLMLQYRSASFFARLYCPEVIFGMQTREELEEIDVTPTGGEPEPAPERRRPTLRERAGVVDAETVAETAKPAAQEAAQAPQTAETAQPPSEAASAASSPASAAPEASATATKAPAIPFEDVLRMAKKAKTADQGDVVRDALRDAAYTEEQRQEVQTILNSKDYLKAGA